AARQRRGVACKTLILLITKEVSLFGAFWGNHVSIVLRSLNRDHSVADSQQQEMASQGDRAME
ncbi:MAG: hypothetical protein ACXW53_17445, partial [Candidatus Binatia bacterium]